MDFSPLFCSSCRQDTPIYVINNCIQAFSKPQSTETPLLSYNGYLIQQVISENPDINPMGLISIAFDFPSVIGYKSEEFSSSTTIQKLYAYGHFMPQLMKLNPEEVVQTICKDLEQLLQNMSQDPSDINQICASFSYIVSSVAQKIKETNILAEKNWFYKELIKNTINFLNIATSIPDEALSMFSYFILCSLQAFPSSYDYDPDNSTLLESIIRSSFVSISRVDPSKFNYIGLTTILCRIMANKSLSISIRNRIFSLISGISRVDSSITTYLLDQEVFSSVISFVLEMIASENIVRPDSMILKEHIEYNNLNSEDIISISFETFTTKPPKPPRDIIKKSVVTSPSLFVSCPFSQEAMFFLSSLNSICINQSFQIPEMTHSKIMKELIGAYSGNISYEAVLFICVWTRNVVFGDIDTAIDCMSKCGIFTFIIRTAFYQIRTEQLIDFVCDLFPYILSRRPTDHSFLRYLIQVYETSLLTYDNVLKISKCVFDCLSVSPSLFCKYLVSSRYDINLTSISEHLQRQQVGAHDNEDDFHRIEISRFSLLSLFTLLSLSSETRGFVYFSEMLFPSLIGLFSEPSLREYVAGHAGEALAVLTPGSKSLEILFKFIRREIDNSDVLLSAITMSIPRNPQVSIGIAELITTAHLRNPSLPVLQSLIFSLGTLGTETIACRCFVILHSQAIMSELTGPLLAVIFRDTLGLTKPRPIKNGAPLSLFLTIAENNGTLGKSLEFITACCDEDDITPLEVNRGTLPDYLFPRLSSMSSDVIESALNLVSLLASHSISPRNLRALFRYLAASRGRAGIDIMRRLLLIFQSPFDGPPSLISLDGEGEIRDIRVFSEIDRFGFLIDVSLPQIPLPSSELLFVKCSQGNILLSLEGGVLGFDIDGSRGRFAYEFATNTWTNICFTISGRQAKLYVHGRKQGEVAIKRKPLGKVEEFRVLRKTKALVGKIGFITREIGEKEVDAIVSAGRENVIEFWKGEGVLLQPAVSVGRRLIDTCLTTPMEPTAYVKGEIYPPLPRAKNSLLLIGGVSALLPLFGIAAAEARSSQAHSNEQLSIQANNDEKSDSVEISQSKSNDDVVQIDDLANQTYSNSDVVPVKKTIVIDQSSREQSKVFSDNSLIAPSEKGDEALSIAGIMSPSDTSLHADRLDIAIQLLIVLLRDSPTAQNSFLSSSGTLSLAFILSLFPSLPPSVPALLARLLPESPSLAEAISLDLLLDPSLFPLPSPISSLPSFPPRQIAFLLAASANSPREWRKPMWSLIYNLPSDPFSLTACLFSQSLLPDALYALSAFLTVKNQAVINYITSRGGFGFTANFITSPDPSTRSALCHFFACCLAFPHLMNPYNPYEWGDYLAINANTENGSCLVSQTPFLLPLSLIIGDSSARVSACRTQVNPQNFVSLFLLCLIGEFSVAGNLAYFLLSTPTYLSFSLSLYHRVSTVSGYDGAAGFRSIFRNLIKLSNPASLIRSIPYIADFLLFVPPQPTKEKVNFKTLYKASFVPSPIDPQPCTRTSLSLEWADVNLALETLEAGFRLAKPPYGSLTKIIAAGLQHPPHAANFSKFVSLVNPSSHSIILVAGAYRSGNVKFADSVRDRFFSGKAFDLRKTLEAVSVIEATPSAQPFILERNPPAVLPVSLPSDSERGFLVGASLAGRKRREEGRTVFTRTARSLAGEGGCWEVGTFDRPKKLSSNLIGGKRWRLVPTLNFSDHKDASLLRDIGNTADAARLYTEHLTSSRMALFTGDVSLLLPEPEPETEGSSQIDDKPNTDVLARGEAVLVTSRRVISGFFIVTRSSVTFDSTRKMVSIPAESITMAIRRRYLLRDSAIEIFTRTFSIFVDLPPGQRDSIFPRIPFPSGCEVIKTLDQARELAKLASQDFVSGRLSTFNYLMRINLLSGRTFHDLSQYPVFPWILSNYLDETLDFTSPGNYRDLSKPMGALSEARLKTLEDREYLYSSFYSSPAVVIGYLIRVEPFTSLHVELQGGRFDKSDRLFNSVPRAWESASSSPMDYRELTPEFFCFPDFLRNRSGFDLGTTMSGNTVNDVYLPPWATSPEDFISKNRSALEGLYVRQNLGKWVDLVFGQFSRGSPNNTFHPGFFSEGGTELDQQFALCFGQAPDLIFTEPSIPDVSLSRGKVIFSENSRVSDAAAAGEDAKGIVVVTRGLGIGERGSIPACEERDSSRVSVSGGLLIAAGVAEGSIDFVEVYPRVRVLNRAILPAGRVTCVSVSPINGLSSLCSLSLVKGKSLREYATGGDDGAVTVWPEGSVVARLEGSITCVSINSECGMVAAADNKGSVVISDTNGRNLKIENFSPRASALTLTSDGEVIIASGRTVYITDVNLAVLSKCEVTYQITSLCMCGGNILLGTLDGIVYVIKPFTMEIIEKSDIKEGIIKTETTADGAVIVTEKGGVFTVRIE